MLDDFQEAIGMGNYKNGFELNEFADDKLDTTKQTLIDQKPLLAATRPTTSRTC